MIILFVTTRIITVSITLDNPSLSEPKSRQTSAPLTYSSGELQFFIIIIHGFPTVGQEQLSPVMARPPSAATNHIQEFCV